MFVNALILQPYSLPYYFYFCVERREKKSETKLYLAGNNYLVSDKRLSDDDIAVFCEALSANTYIAELDLRYNNLTDVGVKHIAEILSVCVLTHQFILLCCPGKVLFCFSCVTVFVTNTTMWNI